MSLTLAELEEILTDHLAQHVGVHGIQGVVLTSQNYTGYSSGLSNLASGTDALALATSATATATDAVGLGHSAAATAAGALAVGKSASAAGALGVALGQEASAPHAKDIALGYRASSPSTNANANGISIGYEANYGVTTGSYTASIAIGRFTQTVASQAIALGDGAFANASGSIAIGVNTNEGFTPFSTPCGTFSIALGNGANAGGSGSIAIGQSAANLTTAADVIAIGHSAAADGASSIAIGKSANAGTYTNAVALGEGATVGANNEFRLGSSSKPLNVATHGHQEFVEKADPGAGAADTARVYARDNGSGKTQLVVVFSSGAVQVIATQP